MKKARAGEARAEVQELDSSASYAPASYNQDRAPVVARAVYMMAKLAPDAGSAIATITEYLRDDYVAFQQQIISEIRPEDE